MTHEQNICFFSLPTENLRLIVRAVSLSWERLAITTYQLDKPTLIVLCVA